MESTLSKVVVKLPFCSNELLGLWTTMWCRNGGGLFGKNKINQKVKNIIWRLYKGWLPTAMDLKKQGIATNTRCFRCSFQFESIYHAIWECPSARDFLKMNGFYNLFLPADEGDIVGFLLKACQVDMTLIYIYIYIFNFGMTSLELS